MSKLVYFKFKANFAQHEIPFEGSCISVKELCQAIRTKFSSNYDLVIIIKDTNSQIEKECSENDLIPAFSNVIVKRMPLKDTIKQPPNKKTINPENFNKIDPYKNMNTNGAGSLFKKINTDSINLTEDQKLDNIIENAGADFKFQFKKPLSGQPPATYTCNKCNIPGHWIHNCPGVPDKNGKLVDSRLVKRPSGIPVCGLTEVDENTPNSYLTPDGRYVVNIKNREAVLKGKKDKRPFSLEENPPMIDTPKNDIPPELQCQLCSKLLDAPTKTGCCGMSYCRICITDCLFDPEKSISMHKCPNCMSVIDKLDKLIDDSDRERQIMVWKLKKFSHSIEKVIEPIEEIKQEEINVQEMTDDDLLNEIFSMSNKENDQPIHENFNQNQIMKTENFNNSERNQTNQSPDEVTAEIIKKLASNNCTEGIIELMKSNPKAIEMIQQIISNVKSIENNNRSEYRSRSRPRYENKKRNGHYINNQYHSSRYESNDYNQRYSRSEEEERIRQRSSENRDSRRRYKNEEKSYSHHKDSDCKRESKYIEDSKKYSNYSPEHRIKAKVYSEDFRNKNQLSCDREIEQSQKIEGKQYFHHRDSDCKREPKYIEDSKKYSNRSPEYRNKSKIYSESFHVKNEKLCDIDTERSHRRFKESNHINSECLTKNDLEEKRYFTSHHKKYQEGKESDKHREINDRCSIYDEKSESRRSRERAKQEKHRSRSPIIHQKSSESKPLSNIKNEYDTSQKKSKDKSHKKHKKSKKNKSKHGEKKKQKKSKHLISD